MNRPRVVVLAALLASAIPAFSLSAQVVEVHLRETSSRAPIAGAVVELLRDTAHVGQALTNAGGRAVLRAPTSGIYRIRVRRIGYRQVTADTVAIGSEQLVMKELSMESAPFVLPAVAVQTKSECGPRMGDGPLLAELWQQIGTALMANVLTDRWRLAMRVTQFRRDVDLAGNIGRELVIGSSVVHGPPFGSPDFAKLRRDGFVYPERDVMVFSAPDAATLLEDDFLVGHCFSAVPGAGESVGLRFEPVPKRRITDVKGTLWINKLTSELQYLEYTYTGLRDELAMEKLGGRVDFKRLPSGAWIVSYWHIRMPVVETPPGGVEFRRGRQVGVPATRRIASFVETGGRVDLSEGAAAIQPRALLRGRIFDSTTSTWLAGAAVRVMGQADSVMTDSLGQFGLTVAVAGNQTVIASHPKLELLENSGQKDVQLSFGDATTVQLAVPSISRFVREFCAAVDPKATGLIGRALSVDGAGAEGLDVRVTWADAPGQKSEERAETGPKGVYILCDLPSGVALTVQLRKGTVVVGEQTITLVGGKYQWVDIKSAK